MKLLVIEPGLKLWGSERAFLASFPVLVADNPGLILMAPPGAELIGALPAGRYDLLPTPIANLHQSGPITRAKVTTRILGVCIRHHVDHIYVNQAGFCRIGHLVSSMLRIPLTIHVRLADDLERCAGLRASAVAPVNLIFISKDMREKYPENVRRDANKRFFTAYDPFELTQTTEDDSAPRDFVCIGRIAEIKGQPELVEAMAINRDLGVQTSLDVIGAPALGDPAAAKTVDRVSELSLESVVSFLGYHDNAPRLLSSYKFMIAPSRYEPLGRVVFEAWDAGALPIVGKGSGGAAEVVKASGGGLFYHAQEPESIAAALRAALALPEAERRALVLRGRAWMRQAVSLQAYQHKLSGLLFQ